MGNETHSSLWGKFYVKGLEIFSAKEDYSHFDRHHEYQEWQCNEIPEATLFTVFYQSGDKHGTKEFYFAICKISEKVEEISDSYSDGYCKGNFEIVAEGIGTTRAPRLMDWWGKRPLGREMEYAEECARMIGKRGQKDAPILPPAGYKEEKPLRLFKGEIATIKKMIDRYGNRFDEALKLIKLEIEEQGNEIV